MLFKKGMPSASFFLCLYIDRDSQYQSESGHNAPTELTFVIASRQYFDATMQPAFVLFRYFIHFFFLFPLPNLLPVVSIANEEAVSASRLSSAWLRQRFSQPPVWEPEVQMEESLFKDLTFRPASVLIPLVLHEAGLSVLLTQRASGLNHHAGQISFPGGRFEPSDLVPVETAIRETEEEIGLNRQCIEVIGTMPEYRTGTGYQVTPVVSLITPPFDIVTDPGEVADVFEVPLSYLMDARNHQRRVFQMPDGSGQRMFYAMPYQQHFIWGATAGMLRNLFHFLRA